MTQEHTINVALGDRSYQVSVGSGLLDRAGTVARSTIGGSKAVIITNEVVGPLYASRVQASLEASGYEVFVLTLPDGEHTKQLSFLQQCLEFLACAGLTRKDALIALGGGVIGDLAGFAAATYMRGVNIVQIPTSLLAMVDSSVGGKVAVDLPQGKNLAGAFWQPKAVLVDVEVLSSLSLELFADSCGEVIKYGVMCDRKLFDELVAQPLTQQCSSDYLSHIIARCIAIKAEIVSKDETESGPRKLLNLGHTFGHAVEAQLHYSLGHGSCVALGLLGMTRACVASRICAQEDLEMLERLIAAHHLPTTLTPQSSEDLMHWMISDKKRSGATIDIITVQALGLTQIKTVDFSELERLLKASGLVAVA